MGIYFNTNTNVEKISGYLNVHFACNLEFHCLKYFHGIVQWIWNEEKLKLPKVIASNMWTTNSGTQNNSVQTISKLSTNHFHSVKKEVIKILINWTKSICSTEISQCIKTQLITVRSPLLTMPDTQDGEKSYISCKRWLNSPKNQTNNLVYMFGISV